jgi:hypothetical protein
MHAHQAGAARHRRGHLFDDLALTPLPVVAVGDDVVEPQIEAESIRAHRLLE